MAPAGYRVNALERGLKVLAAFAPERPVLGVSEVARRVSIPVATVYRLLRTLADAGYVDQLRDGRFTLTPKVLTLGFAALQSSDVVDAAQQPLRALASETGETTNLGVRIDERVLYLLRFKTEHLMIANIQPGSTLPLVRTSMGKLLLALDGDTGDLRRLLRAPQGEVTGPRAIKTAKALTEELALVRERGWATQNEELAPNLRSVAVPVWSAQGLAGAINIAVDGQRVSQEKLIEELLPRLQRTASEISLRLGYLDAVRPAPSS